MSTELSFCTLCEQNKSISDFSRYSKGRIRKWFKACVAEHNRLKRHENWEEHQHKNRIKLLANHGLTEDEYHKLVEENSSRCEICSKLIKKLIIDHNHRTNQRSGLLCSNCNAGLGFLKDDPNILSNAINYLRKYDAT